MRKALDTDVGDLRGKLREQAAAINKLVITNARSEARFDGLEARMKALEEQYSETQQPQGYTPAQLALGGGLDERR